MPHDLIELLENLLLHVHALEHRFDDQIDVLELRIVEGRRDQRHALIERGLGQGAFLQRAAVVAPHGGESLVEGLLLHLQQHHRNSRIDETHADSAAHRARADDADFANGPGRRVIRHVENVRRRALRLKHMTQRRGFRRQHERGEQFAFSLDAGIEGPVESRRDRFHAGHRRRIAAGNRLGGIARELKKGLVIRHVDLQIAHAPHAQFFGHDFACKCARPHRANRPPQTRRTTVCREAFRKRTVAPGDDHVERGFGADQRGAAAGVPPAPGNRPNFTSGSAIFAPAAATR